MDERPASKRREAGSGMLSRLKRRYLDLLASIYIYNEHRGYTSIDRILDAVRAHYPNDRAFIAEVEKHRADERKHYVMFRRYFEARREMPFKVDRTCGHIDRFIRIMFGCPIDDLDTAAVIADVRLFNRLCRVIMLTEQRGMRMVDTLLASPTVRSDRPLFRIFQTVERDEPSHWAPYEAWLQSHGGGRPRLSERIADTWVHFSLILTKVPLLYFNPRLARRTNWYDDTAAAQAAG